MRYINMALSRRAYVNECESTSRVLVEHVIKLLMFISPNDVRGWLVSIAKGLDCETSKVDGMKKKPIEAHLSYITNRGDSIDLEVLENKIESVLRDPDYSNLQRRNLTSIQIKSAINDLIYGLDRTKIYSNAEIDKYLSTWYSETKQLLRIN